MDSTVTASPRALSLAGILLAAAALVHFLATWDFDGQLAPQSFAIRHYSIPVVLIEFCVIWIAARDGISFRQIFSKISKLASALLGIWLIFAITALLADRNGLANSAITLVRYMLHGSAFVSLIYIISRNGAFDQKRWLEWFAIGGIFYVGAIALFSVTVAEPDKFPWMLRLPSATNIRQIGNNLGMLAVAPVALLLMNQGSTKWRYWLAVVAILSFMLWTGSRATLLGLAIGVSAGLAAVRSVMAVRNLLLLLTSSVAAAAVSLLFPIPHPAFGMFRMVDSIGAQEDVSSGRWEMWANTIEQITLSPWIGYGSGRYRENMQEIYGFDYNHPHNFVLQYVYDWGLIGGLAAATLLLLLGVWIWRSKASDPLSAFVAVTAYTTICVTAMIDSPLFHPLPIVIAIALISPLLAKPAVQTPSSTSAGGT